MRRMNNGSAKRFARYPRLNPSGLGRNISAADLIDRTFLAYNAGRLREAARLLTEKMLPGNGLIGMSLTGALTPAGLGKSCLIPLMRAGFVDWIVSTGANLYHDLHYGLDMALYQGSPFLNDVALHRDGIIRIYDILFDYHVLLDTDAFVRRGHPGAGVSAHDGHGRISLSAGPICFRTGPQDGSARQFDRWRRLTNAASRFSPAARATVPSA